MNQIPDQSEYRPGDELDVRSPFYEEHLSSEYDDKVIQLEWEVNTHDNEYETAQLTVVAYGVFQNYINGAPTQYSLMSIEIKSLEVGERLYSFEEAKQCFDKDTFNMNDITEHVCAYLSQQYDYTF